MTQIDAAAVRAREQARTATGEFGTQTHSDPGIVRPPICVDCHRPADTCKTDPCVHELLSRNNRTSISVNVVVDDTIDEHGEEAFDQHGDGLDMQIRYLCEAFTPHGHIGTDVYCEPQYDLEDGHMYGVSIGFKDRKTGCDTSLFQRSDDMFEGLDGTSGRERATLIATEIARVYDAVYDCYHPEQRAASDAFYAEHPEYA